MLDIALAVLFGIAGLPWLFLTLTTLREAASLRRLPPAGPVAAPPRVSVVVAARNEQDRIEATVRRLLAQQGIERELIVVDDRSTDDTPGILARLAAEDGRVRVVTVRELPAGWLGKCHACHQGARAATGDWLLFTDGDVWIGPDVVARAVQAARRESAGHVCVFFQIGRGTPLGRAAQLCFALAALNGAFRGVNRDRPDSHAGVGAFNLIDARLYHQVGGHESLKLTVIDDIRLGLLVRRAGGRTRLYLGGPDVEAEWVASAPGMVRLLEKNFFAVTRYSWVRSSLAVVILTACWGLAVVGPWVGGPAGLAAGIALLLTTVPALILARRSRASGWPALLVPVAWPVLPLALANSAWKAWQRGGVRWRDTFYPLAELRAGDLP